CMSPCHGFNGIVDQWKTSTHYVGVIPNNDEVPTWTGPGPCGNCHASDGLPNRLAGVVTPTDGGPPGLARGQTEYLAGGAVKEIAYAGQSNVAVIGCTTCHAVDATNDPHVTGALYMPGTFALRVPHGATDEALIEKSPAPGAVTGTPAGAWQQSNTCVFCHKSRKDVTNTITATTNISNGFWGPHEGPHSDIFSGVGGYHYASQTYRSSTHQQLSGCSACHMPKVAANHDYPDHSMVVHTASCTGASCHAGATSFDVGGGQGVVKAALGEMQALLNGLGVLSRASAAPYDPLAPADLADGRYDLDRTRAGTLTDAQAGALYNYLLIARGSAWGVHNPIYVKELLYDSIFALKGAPPNVIPARP
ncbi:MAG TPA: hypothetical protein VIF62_21220, partial [Labilithrix sp.]